ncbi:site-specific integrase [uncultured Legionella sp.]|uniref:tyrosine-type recombinase/integrase n=1 Tax=uncultured Legionella sp. TaxID=210934 RepID=UPI00263564FC|nr:site-specific integrase [uncultured Legionella sp.]
MAKACVLNENEFKRLFMAAEDSPFALRNVAIIYCSFGLGLSVKEIAALTFLDVVDQNFKILDEVKLKRINAKGEKQRDVYISNIKIITALQDYVDSIRAQNQEIFNLKTPLFKTQRGNRFHPDVLQKWFRKLYDKSGLTGASSHSGRRTFITRLIEQGADIKSVSRLAGHANIATTSGYIIDNPGSLKRLSNLAVF